MNRTVEVNNNLSKYRDEMNFAADRFTASIEKLNSTYLADLSQGRDLARQQLLLSNLIEISKKWK
jgi:hypothetical protein